MAQSAFLSDEYELVEEFKRRKRLRALDSCLRRNDGAEISANQKIFRTAVCLRGNDGIQNFSKNGEEKIPIPLDVHDSN